MIVTNQKIIKELSADDYFALPGFSFSGLTKKGDFVPTEKMKLGTDVHNYLLTPEVYHHQNIRIVKPIAMKIKEVIGELINHLQAELAVTADFEHEGIVMPYKGRVDLSILKRIVIDIKIGDSDIYKTKDYFLYEEQVSGYAYGIGARAALIIHCNPRTFKVTIINVPIRSDWWEQKIISYGYIIN